MPHFLTIWQFQVKTALAAEFERIYGRDGSWSQLFRRSPDYLGTELVRDLDHAGRYLTIDRWTSRAALNKFKQEYAAGYAALDRQCERLTESETMLGEFESSTPFPSAPSPPP